MFRLASLLAAFALFAMSGDCFAQCRGGGQRQTTIFFAGGQAFVQPSFVPILQPFVGVPRQQGGS